MSSVSKTGSINRELVYSGWMALFIVLSPLFDGLFAPVEFMPPVIILLACFLLAGSGNTQGERDRMAWVAGAFAVVAFAAAFQGVDRGLALADAYRYLLYMLLLLIAMRISISQIQFFYQLIFISGLLIAALGLSTLGTDFFLTDGMRAQRLQGSFSYANTTAIYLLVSLMLGLFLTVNLDGWKRSIHLAGTYTCAAALFLTGSRTVWILWPIALGLSIVLSDKEERPYWFLVASFISLFSAVFGYGIHIEYVAHRTGVAYLFFLLGLVLVPAGAYYLFEQLTKRPLREISSTRLVPWLLLGLLLGGLMFAGSTLNRPFSLNASEFQGRLTYYIDALSMIRDYPWLGLGGGGWSSLQYDYQTALYSVSLVHNSILQVALDSGILGLLLFMMLVIYSAQQWFKARAQLINSSAYRLLWPSLLGGLLIGVHSLFDVDLAFPAAAVLFFFFLAVPWVAASDPDHNTPQLKLKYVTTIWPWARGICILVLLMGAVILWSASLQQLQGDKLAHAGQFNLAVERYQQSLRWFPYSAYTANQMGVANEQQFMRNGQVSYLTAAAQDYEQAHRLNHYEPRYLENLAYVKFELARYDESIAYFRELIQKNPMVIRHYENLAYVLVVAGEGRGSESNAYYKSVLDIPKMLNEALKNVSSRGWELRDIPELTVTNRLAWKMGQAEYYLGHLDLAQALWRQAEADPAVQAEMRRWSSSHNITLVQ